MDELSLKIRKMLAAGDKEGMKAAFDAAAVGVTKLYVQEESFAEKILPVKNVKVGDGNVQRDLAANSDSVSPDTFYYFEQLEQTRMASFMNPRATGKPSYEESNFYKIYPMKIESDPFQKSYFELQVNPNIVDMLKTGSADSTRRLQDAYFMGMVNDAITKTGNQVGGTSGADIIDFSTNGFDKQQMVNAITRITDQEIPTGNVLMSTSGYTFLSGIPASEVGDKAGDLLVNGYSDDKLINLPIVKTTKAALTAYNDPTLKFFSSVVDGKVFYHFYLFTEPEYLGRIATFESDRVQSKWEDDIFNWKTWRYWGMGFGDVRGIVRFTFRVR